MVEPIKLDLSLGVAREGFKRLSIQDLPYPLPDESVSEVVCVYAFMRVPAGRRAAVMDELYRVMKTGAQALFIVPYWNSARAIMDPTAEWPPLSEQSFLYFDKTWRDANAADISCKADFPFTYGYTFDPETQNRPDETRAFWAKHYTNTIVDLQVALTKR